ncbi:MAG: outer membrane beta-barrel domain-containing protein [Myxococcota bacterium]
MIKQRYASQRLSLALVVGLLGIAVAEQAHALQGGEDAALFPVLVDKRFGMQGRHQLALQFSTAMATKYIDVPGGLYLTYDYNFWDTFGIEVGGGYMFSKEADILKEVRNQAGSDQSTVDKLQDINQLQWMANVDAIFVPVYGKISFASEIDPSYDLFLLLGGGVTGIRSQVGADAVRTYSSHISPLFNFGVGFRFYFFKMFALRLEFRDFFFPDPSPDGGLTFSLQFQAGVQVNFGGP